LQKTAKEAPGSAADDANVMLLMRQNYVTASIINLTYCKGFQLL